MARYYGNDQAQANGDHEVHQQNCSFLPAPENRTYLGEHTSCYQAVAAAKQIYPQANGCYYCSNRCHTGRAAIEDLD